MSEDHSGEQVGYREGLEDALRILAEHQAKWEEKAERTAENPKGKGRTLAAQRIRAAAYKTAGDRVRALLNRHVTAAAKRPQAAPAGDLPGRLRGNLRRLGI
jgi:hypothetical protein